VFICFLHNSGTPETILAKLSTHITHSMLTNIGMSDTLNTSGDGVEKTDIFIFFLNYEICDTCIVFVVTNLLLV